MKIPPPLNPLQVAPLHPASCAYWVTASPHEWVWNNDEQIAMARAVVAFDQARSHALPLLQEIHKHPDRTGPIQVLAAKLMIALGLMEDKSKENKAELLERMRTEFNLQ